MWCHKLLLIHSSLVLHHPIILGVTSMPPFFIFPNPTITYILNPYIYFPYQVILFSHHCTFFTNFLPSGLFLTLRRISCIDCLTPPPPPPYSSYRPHSSTFLYFGFLIYGCEYLFIEVMFRFSVRPLDILLPYLLYLLAFPFSPSHWYSPCFLYYICITFFSLHTFSFLTYLFHTDFVLVLDGVSHLSYYSLIIFGWILLIFTHLYVLYFS